MVHSWSTKTDREWIRLDKNKVIDYVNTTIVQTELKRLHLMIKQSEFNKKIGGRFLVMISGDIHMMAYDTGSIDMAKFGDVPLF